jgi:septum formation topological specificity factor MinE
MNNQGLSSMNTLPQGLSSLKDLPQGLSSMNTLPKEILHNILKYIQTPSIPLLLVCKHWKTTILEKSIICPTCKKITNIYDNVLWITDKDDDFCHGYYDTLERYKILKIMLKDRYKFLKMINRQSYGLCLNAIKHNHSAIDYVTNLTDELINKALCINPLVIKYIFNPSYDQCLTSIRSDTLQYIPSKYRTPEMYIKLITNDPLAIQYVHNPSEELCYLALKNDPSILRHIRNQTEKICLYAISHKDWLSAMQEYIKVYTENIFVELYKKGHIKLFRNYEFV